MSWMSQNYHKAALGGGVVVLAAVGYLSWSKGAEVKEGFEVDSSTKPGDEVTVEGGPIADEILKDLKELNPLKAKTLPNGRVVNLFTSVDLFVANGDIDNPIDLLDPDLADVHPPIPHRSWVAKRVDPSFSDSPQKDEDGDGFSNLEEFNDKTDPSDSKNYPLLVKKLVVKSVDSTYWLLELNSSFGNNDFQFRYNDSKKVALRMGAADNAKAGDIFFKDGVKKNRFKVIEKVNKVVAGKAEIFALVEDLKPNKGNVQFLAPYRPKVAVKKDFYRFDNTVTFTLEAVGQEGKEIVVEENTSFKVTADGKTFEYKLIEVDMGERPNVKPLAAIVEYDDNGEKKTRRIEIK